MGKVSDYIVDFKRLSEFSVEKVLRRLSDSLIESGYAKDSFLRSVLEREETYPTGLPASIGVAIPHTDPHHIHKPGISIGVLQEPVVFQMMGNSSERIHVEIVFMLAIKDPKEQVKLLQSLMELIQSEELLSRLKECNSLDEVKSSLTIIPIGSD
ncbi:PTS sugar transporter subunit IIA [Alkalihalobacillus sp. CinArs1]|uniref:PTS sugar transporter subunit IIA n=1 Tax=Alkalihalobacillus sp. CinArs1 TaxID=2995314 RepID=UPI0022DDF03D|nr:PTS sugar transporter subunit IIA [Alkalihalobacillus sp. CinArs1]